MGLKFDFSKVKQRLATLDTKAQKEVLDRALDAGNKEVLRALEINVPVNTGITKENLGEISKTGSSTDRKSKLGVKSKEKSIVARVFYTEYGNRRQVGTHWMKKSFNQSKGEAKKKIIASLKKDLKL